MTRGILAVVNVPFAVSPGISQQTLARVSNWLDVDARSPVNTRVHVTGALLQLAVVPTETVRTPAKVVGNQVNASGIIQTGAGPAFVYVHLARGTSVAWTTDTGVGKVAVYALGAVATRGTKTLVVRLFAVGPNPTGFAQTLVATLGYLSTHPLVLARVEEAFLHVPFTLGPSKPR